MKLIGFFFVLIALVSSRTAWGQQYQRSNSEIEKCTLDKIRTLIPKLRYEPFKMDSIYADMSTQGVKMKATIRNVVAYGGSKFRIEYFKVKPHYNNQYTSEVKVVFPYLDVTANYYFKGMKLFVIPFTTYGKFHGKFNNVEVVFKYSISSYIKYGVKYLKIDDVTTKVSIGNGQLNLRPAVSNYIGNLIASYARLNPSEALWKLTPAIEMNAASIFMNYFNNLMARVPLQVYAC